MNCFDEIELVIEYMEHNLNCVNITDISRITGIPSGLYQRIFSYICGISISDYVRKRKLTKAGNEILENQGNVIEIAMKYGYDSHSAFTRAFKEQFGVPPTNLTSEILKTGAYHRFSFQGDHETYYVMKGRRIMADIVRIEYAEMEERLLIGISKSQIGVGGHELWGRYFDGGFSEKLGELEEYQCEDMTEDYIGLGYATDFKDEKSLGNEYIIGRYFKLGTPVPEHMMSRIIPRSTVVKAQVKGKTLDDIINNAYILINDMVKKNGYILDYKNFYWSEVYTYERFCIPNDKGEEIILDWYMPCIKECNKDKQKVISTTAHYDYLIDENNDPVNDSEKLTDYMNQWDGSKFFHELDLNNDKSVLEVGVGTGRLALRVLKRGCKNFVGIDLSPKTINKAEEHLKDYSNYSLITGDYLTVEIHTSFDIIYSSLTFSHIEDKASAIKKTWSLLNDDGRFVLSIEKNTLDYLEYGNHKVKMFPDDFEQTVSLLEECGFHILRVNDTDFAHIITAIKK